MPLVYYKGANQHTVSAGPKHRIRLNPGKNVVDDDLWNAVLAASEKEHATSKPGGTRYGLKPMIDKGLILVVEGDKVTENTMVDLTKLTKEDALHIVENEVSTDNLAIMLEQEKTGKKRKQVLNAIETAVIKITTGEQSEAERKAAEKSGAGANHT